MHNILAFRRAIRGSEPSAAHRALAVFEAALPACTHFLRITQNVDDLHQRAGSRNMCEYHGTLARWRCDLCAFSHGHPTAPSRRANAASSCAPTW